MGSVSFKKTFILSLCVTAIVHISQCNSYPANDVWMSEKKDDSTLGRFTVEQEDNSVDSAAKHSSLCQMGNTFKKCWPKTCPTEGYKIIFTQPFDEVPSVMVAVNSLDIDKNFNSRLRLIAEEVTKTGFTLSIIRWADTRLYSVGASWTACSSRETPCRRR